MYIVHNINSGDESFICVDRILSPGWYNVTCKPRICTRKLDYSFAQSMRIHTLRSVYSRIASVCLRKARPMAGKGERGWQQVDLQSHAEGLARAS